MPPLYEHSCPNGHAFDIYAPIKKFKAKRKCPTCGKMAGIVIGRVSAFVQADCCYDSPIDGRPITSRARRREDMARNNCQEYDPEMRKDAERFRKQQDEKLEKSMDATVEEAIEKMPRRKKELLERELRSGASAEIVRSTQ